MLNKVYYNLNYTNSKYLLNSNKQLISDKQEIKIFHKTKNYEGSKGCNYIVSIF